LAKRLLPVCYPGHDSVMQHAHFPAEQKNPVAACQPASKKVAGKRERPAKRSIRPPTNMPVWCACVASRSPRTQRTSEMGARFGSSLARNTNANQALGSGSLKGEQIGCSIKRERCNCGMSGKLWVSAVWKGQDERSARQVFERSSHAPLVRREWRGQGSGASGVF